MHAEACRRGNRFDAAKFTCMGPVPPLPLTEGQVEYEWAHLRSKLEQRAPAWLLQFDGIRRPEPHPLFRVRAGRVAEWEVGAWKDPVSADSG